MKLFFAIKGRYFPHFIFYLFMLIDLDLIDGQLRYIVAYILIDTVAMEQLGEFLLDCQKRTGRYRGNK